MKVLLLSLLFMASVFAKPSLDRSSKEDFKRPANTHLSPQLTGSMLEDYQQQLASSKKHGKRKNFTPASKSDRKLKVR